MHMAIRPWSITSMAGIDVVPPACVTLARVASASSTMMYELQKAPIWSGTPGIIGLRPATNWPSLKNWVYGGPIGVGMSTWVQPNNPS